MKHERFWRDENGVLRSEIIAQDDRTIEEARRERTAALWAQARFVLTQRLESRGYDHQSAEALASMLLYQELPVSERQTLQGLASDIATRALQRMQDVRRAPTNDDVDAVSP